MHGPATIRHARFMGHIIMKTTLTDRMFSHLQRVRNKGKLLNKYSYHFFSQETKKEKTAPAIIAVPVTIKPTPMEV